LAFAPPTARAEVVCPGDPTTDNAAPIRPHVFHERVLDGLSTLSRSKREFNTSSCWQQGRDLQAQLKMDLANGAIVLLGEVHDNPAHHTRRSSTLRDSVAKLSAVVFEHIRTDQQPALDRFTEFNATARRLGTSSDMFRFLDWDKSGWPDKKIFEPLFSAAIQNKLPIYPGDLPRDTMRRAAKEGETALPPEERARLKLDTPLAPALNDALLTELEESHCGMMPKTAFGKMAFAQRYRDAHLADAVLKAAETHSSAILLAGNGHMRTDRGVPYYLRQRAPDKKIVSVMLVEVEEGKTDPRAYIPLDPDGKPAADYIVLTPRQGRPDPCEQMRAAMKGKKG
jgi:uncharacterized iron-regulated protein